MHELHQVYGCLCLRAAANLDIEHSKTENLVKKKET